MNSNPNFFEKLRELDDDEIKEKALAQECFRRFQSEEDNTLHLDEFRLFLDELFTGATSDDELQEMFHEFDVNNDDKIDEEEFERVWSSFVIAIVKPKCALIVIDVQNDFIDGSLAIRNCSPDQDGYDVVPSINELLSSAPFHAVVYTYDWHPENHVSFADNVSMRSLHESSPVSQSEAKVFDIVVFEGSPPMEQKLWPKHCVQESWGSNLHPDLKVVDDAIFIYKGSSPDIDSYSAFWDNQKRSQTNLAQELRDKGITDVFVCGLAYDFCVGFTALHALEDGFRTVLVEDACRGICQKNIDLMKENLISKNAVVVTSNVVRDMISGKERKPKLGYFLIKLLKRMKEEL